MTGLATSSWYASHMAGVRGLLRIKPSKDTLGKHDINQQSSRRRNDDRLSKQRCTIQLVQPCDPFRTIRYWDVRMDGDAQHAFTARSLSRSLSNALPSSLRPRPSAPTPQKASLSESYIEDIKLEERVLRSIEGLPRQAQHRLLKEVPASDPHVA